MNKEYKIRMTEDRRLMIEVSAMTYSLFLISSLAATMHFNPANWQGQGALLTGNQGFLLINFLTISLTIRE